jgi:hypothetical protein
MMRNLCVAFLFLLLTNNSCTNEEEQVGEIKWQPPKCALPKLPALHRDTIFMGDTLHAIKAKHKEALSFKGDEESIDPKREIAMSTTKIQKGVWATELFRTDRGILIDYHITIRKDGKQASTKTLLEDFSPFFDYADKGQDCSGLKKYLSIRQAPFDGKWRLTVILAVY